MGGRRMGRGSVFLASCLVVLLSGMWMQAVRASSTGTITEFPVPTAGAGLNGITAGPDGNLWFAERGGNKVGRITPDGVITEFAMPTAGTGPNGITAGPDGNLWFTERSIGKIGRITPAGGITQFSIPTASSQPNAIALGPDGNLWFTEQSGNKIGRITLAGTVTEFPVPTGRGAPFGITAGADGNLWFTELNGNKIGRITRTGTITEFPLSLALRLPSGITAGPDGNVWFAERGGNSIGQITPSGTITEFLVPSAGTAPVGIATGADGDLWFTANVGNTGGQLTPAGEITAFFPVPTPGSAPFGIASGPDGNIWFTENLGNKVGRLEVADDATPPTITLTTPPEGAAYLLDQAVLADYSCQDEEEGSGLASCVGSVPDGEPIDTSSPGGHTFTVTATDQAGNTASVTHSYVVFAGWGGRADLPPAVNRVNAGSAVPLAFDLGHDRGPGIFAEGYPTSQRVGCDTMEPIGSPTSASTAPGKLNRSASGRYTYVWKTDRGWEGTCRRLVLGFSIDGGAQAILYFRLA